MFSAKTLIATATLAAALVATPAAAQAGSYAQTPSGNIACKAESHGGYRYSLVCSIASSGQSVKIGTNGRASYVAYRPISGGRILEYGSYYSVGAFECKSAQSGLSCTARQAPGSIFLSRASVRAWNS